MELRPDQEKLVQEIINLLCSQKFEVDTYTVFFKVLSRKRLNREIFPSKLDSFLGNGNPTYLRLAVLKEDYPDILEHILDLVAAKQEVAIERQDLTLEESTRAMAMLRNSPDKALTSNIMAEDLKAYIDKRTAKKILWDEQLKKISDISYDTYEEIVKHSSLEAEAAKELLRLELANITYDPYNLENMYHDESDSRSIVVINEYNPPAWRAIPATEELECPTEIAEFMTFLIPDKECRRFTFNWLKQAVLSRNETYLVLNGAKGIGKTNIFGAILEALVGTENFFLAPKGIFESNFNGFLSENRVILFDELTARDEKELSVLKKYANAMQTVEKKGLDIGKSIKTFNSYIICNNNVNDIRLAPDDRRFSVIDMTETTLNSVKTEEETRKFLNKLKDNPAYVASFGHWLLNREYPQYNEFSVWKGPRFYKMVEASLTTVERILVSKILSKSMDSYKFSDILVLAKEEGLDKRAKFSKQKVEQFLQNYLHEGKYRLGSVKGEGKLMTVIPAKEFLPASFIPPKEVTIEDFDLDL